MCSQNNVINIHLGTSLGSTCICGKIGTGYPSPEWRGGGGGMLMFIYARYMDQEKKGDHIYCCRAQKCV